jgi:hypothetical protein
VTPSISISPAEERSLFLVAAPAAQEQEAAAASGTKQFHDIVHM